MEKGKRGNKKKSRKIILAAACIGLAAAAGGFFFWQKGNTDASEGTIVIAAGENEEIIYAQIDSIVGNDIDVSLMKENAQAEAETQVKDTQKAAENKTDGVSEAASEKIAGDTPEGMLQGMSEDMPEGMPQGMSEDTPEGMPQGMSGDMPDGFPGNGNSGMNSGVNGSRNSAGSAAAYTETGEAKSFEIPAGTQVITKLGVETTFSRLSAGNIIALLLEEGTDNILKIWVVS